MSGYRELKKIEKQDVLQLQTRPQHGMYKIIVIIIKNTCTEEKNSTCRASCRFMEDEQKVKFKSQLITMQETMTKAKARTKKFGVTQQKY